MKITVMTADEQIVTLDVDRDESVENLKALLEVEEIRNAEKLSAVGVNDGDLVMMVSLATSSAATNDLGFNPDGSAVNPATFQRQIRQDSNMMARLFQADPELAQVLLGNDLNRLQEVLRQRHHQKSALQRQQDEELALLHADPFDVEAQKKIEAAIRQKGIDENWAAALEHNPEGFARVVCIIECCSAYLHLLIVELSQQSYLKAALSAVDNCLNYAGLLFFCTTNLNEQPIHSLVFTLADSSQINFQLLRLLDQRYKGIAHGVGQSEILGRIHVAPIKIGNVFYPCSFLVLDSPNMDFLFGLDMLRKHQCIIDLKDNVLRLGGGEVSVPFLQEKDIPSQYLDEERKLKQASSSGAQASSGSRENSNAQTGGGARNLSQAVHLQGPEFEAKVTRLVELGFGREAVIQALNFFDGNEDQAAGYLFGG
ncbi:hypothetical protein RHGRI_018817 [Rhododendron griersonianum]|uniref:UBA domain-containing protein n=1 Tax=Rhododendron griersonianum TaxID=479676 RepID=A0AAV6K360_9ERIC|nr:hypothetical protein RHGRI_018817 [Rhododendron griersonianum]